MEIRNPQDEYIPVKISDIMKKIRTKEDMINCMRERVKIAYNNFRIIFP